MPLPDFNPESYAAAWSFAKDPNIPAKERADWIVWISHYIAHQGVRMRREAIDDFPRILDQALQSHADKLVHEEWLDLLLRVVQAAGAEYPVQDNWPDPFTPVPPDVISRMFDLADTRVEDLVRLQASEDEDLGGLAESILEVVRPRRTPDYRYLISPGGAEGT